MENTAGEIENHLPGVNKGPVVVVFFQVFWDRGAGPVHEIQIEIVHLQVLQ